MIKRNFADLIQRSGHFDFSYKNVLRNSFPLLISSDILKELHNESKALKTTTDAANV